LANEFVGSIWVTPHMLTKRRHWEKEKERRWE